MENQTSKDKVYELISSKQYDVRVAHNGLNEMYWNMT